MKHKSLKMVMLVTIFLMIVVGSVHATGEPEGCTPGYWKNHLDTWQGYDPDDSYAEIFGVNYDKTLLEALEAGGGGEKALGRHAVAALLNTQQLNYRWKIDDILHKVQRAYGYQIFEQYKDQFEEYNEQYCPLD